MTLQALTRVQRSLLRAGNPYIPEGGVEQLRQSHRGEALRTYADGRYFLMSARAAKRSTSDALRIHLRQRVYLHPSKLIVAESLRQLVQAIADSGNQPAKMMIQAMESSVYHSPLAGNHYAYREKAGFISYCPTGRVQSIGENGRWERAGRQETTPARWVRSVLKASRVKRLRDHEVAEFAEKFKAEELRGQVELVETSDFVEAYKSSHYPHTNDSLYSCMWNDPVQSFYANAPCVVLIAKRGDGMYVGRALIWNSVQGTGGARFMDRVYSDTPEVREMFIAYAREHGLWKKAKESAQCRTWQLPDGSLSTSALSVLVDDLDEQGFYTYMDTFSRSVGDRMKSYSDDDDEYAYASTSGGREELQPHKGQVQLHDGDWIDEEDACEVDGRWYHSDDCVLCDNSGEWILTADAYRVELSRTHTVYIHEDYVSRA